MHIAVALIIIGLVLIQHGKGADMGASFGGGASKTVFGSRGAAPFLMKLTGFFAAVFFATSLSLGYLSKEQVIASNTLIAPSTLLSPEQTTESSTQPSAPATDNSTKQTNDNSSSPLNQIKDQSNAGVGNTPSSSSAVKKETSTSSNSPLDQIKSQSQ